MGMLHWTLQTLGWLIFTSGACFLAYQAGRRKECGLWEAWHEKESALKLAERAEQEQKRSVTLTTVQFRRD